MIILLDCYYKVDMFAISNNNKSDECSVNKKYINNFFVLCDLFAKHN